MTQLLDSPQLKLDNSSNQLQTVLEDIVNQVEIGSDFSVRHPGYKPLELAPKAVTRFQKIPEEMQQKYLSLQLRSFLYGIYYSGSMRQALALDAEENNLALDLENNTVLGVDLEFYNRIHTSNNGQGYFEPGWSILKEEEDGSLVVLKGGLKLHIERDQHLQPTEQDAEIGDTVAIKMPKNCMQNGFYVSVGNARANLHKDESGLVRIYFNLTPDGAVAVMGSLTRLLNEQNIPFDFKVLYNPQDYQRHDSGVLYFDKSSYQLVHQVLQQIYQEHQSHFKVEVPLFTLQLAPGLALAEEPNQKFAERESFGMNRCQIVANGLLELVDRGSNSFTERMTAILAQFSTAGISLEKPYLNSDSSDIYEAIT
jgi:hypothetical protein